MIIFLLLFSYVQSQPCTPPTQLKGSTAVAGSCGSNVASTSSTDFLPSAMGGNSVNNDVYAFSITMWVNPNPPTANGPTYSLFRVTMDASDTTLSTTDGIRLALYLRTDANNYNNRGMNLGYAELPSTPQSFTDLSQFAFSYAGGNWIFIYAGLNYIRGEMSLFAWETTSDTPLYSLFQASKESFNTPLQSSSLQLNLLYWGQFLQFCGSMMQVNWFPGYYESSQNSIRKLPYYLANPTIKQIYYYAWDLQSATTDVNRVTNNTITHTPNQIGYNVLNDSIRAYTLEAIKWDYTALSFTLSMHINFQVLPVSGNDLIIFQRQTSGQANIISYIFGRQADGTIGMIVQIANTQYVLASFSMAATTWYFFQVQIAFHLAVTGQNNALAFYSLVGQDNDYSNNGFVVLPYSNVFGNSIQSSDVSSLGSSNNIYPGSVYIRHVSLQSGFSIFTGTTTTNINCLSNCYIGQVLKGSSASCYLCAPPTYLDTYGGTCVTKCPTNFYPIGLSTSYEVCSGCNTALNYYVNIASQCIIAKCPNLYQELTEECDDGNSVNGDGCSATCTLEIGFKCNAVLYQTTTCVKLCGNGVDDSSGPYVEQCDDGNSVNGDGCDSSCQIESSTYSCLPYFPTVCALLCGNGKLDQAVGQTEQCDDGNIVAGDGCDASCQIESGFECTQIVNQLSSCNLLCGNGQKVAPELCDDGNQVNNDGCTNCLVDKGYICKGDNPDICTALCGNGVIDLSNSLLVEHCDDGNGVPYDGCTNCQIDNGWNCYGGDALTITTCENCGNGKREGQEVCDDGNTIDGDGCTNCKIDSGWTCNGQSPDQCGNCGNGFKEQIEQCDDGNTVDNDGCTACKIDLFYSCFGGSPTTKDTCILQCPNGIVSGTETCDDNNNVSNDGCTFCQVDAGFVCVGQPSVCSQDTCGNGLRNSQGEKCDDGNTKSGDGCDSTCQIESGWLCSGGGLKTKDTCHVVCGDGIKIQNVEKCDDGNQVDGDGCSQKCTIEQGWDCSGGSVTAPDTCYLTCGNNIRQASEQCDDGNIRNGDGCSSICLIETGWGCEPLVIQILDQKTNKIVPVATKGDQCFQCVKNCAVCSSEKIKDCSLCHQGYYLDFTNNICNNQCRINTYPNPQTQTCDSCQEGCEHCFDNNSCYKCAGNKVLNGTSCVNLCSYGWFVKNSTVKGQWCKKCPPTCSSCLNESACLSCIDHYSLSRGQCVACNLGGLCLQCDVQNSVCTSCVLGYRPVGKECIKISEICGDGFKSSLEECDDGNNLNEDGCSRQCKIEAHYGCHLERNEGPSNCFNVDGWKITLTTYILDPTRVRITFSDQVQYDYNVFDSYDKLFNVTILSFKWNEFNVSYGNISNTTVDLFFDFKKNVISQKMTLKLKQKNVLHNQNGVGVSKDYYSITTKLEDVEYYSDSQLEAFNLYTKVIMGLQYYQWLMVVSGGFLGSNQKLWKIVEVMQVTAILQFVNVPSYPLNLQTIIDQFQDSLFYLGENPLTQHSEDSVLNLRRFMYSRLTYYCLNNSGGRFLLAVAISLGFYLLLKMIYNRFIFNLLQVFLDKFEYSFFFKLYEVFLLDMMLGCINNIYFNSMNSNWEGTNTVIAFILMSFVGLVQIGSMIIAFFYEKFGTKKEIEQMFGTLFDGTNTDTRWRRVLVTQQDFARKFVIAYGLIYQSDPAAQLYMIMLPRAIILVITLACKIYKDPIVIFREIITECLFEATLGLLYVYSTSTYVDNLQAKVDAGWQIVFIILSNICFNGAVNTYIIWNTLKILELALPDNSEKVNLNKGVDLFKLKREKKVKPEEQVKQQELDIDEQERKALQDKKINDMLNLKNADREKWNVWDMNRDARPEEQRFVSILQDNRRAISQEQQRQSSKQPSDQLQSHHSEEEDHSHHEKQSVASGEHKDQDEIDPFAVW